MRSDSLVVCQLCGRRVPQAVMTEHHLVPRERGGGKDHVVPICRPCHGHIHAIYDNKTLAGTLATIKALRKDPQLRKFIKFIRKQDPAARFSSATAERGPKRGRRRR